MESKSVFEFWEMFGDLIYVSANREQFGVDKWGGIGIEEDFVWKEQAEVLFSPL